MSGVVQDHPSGSSHLGFQGMAFLKQEKAPQVGLEPTTLRLTEGFQVVAGSCGLLLRHSSSCFYRIFRLAEWSKVFASVCGLLRLQNGKQTATFSGLMSGNQQQSVIMIQV